MDPLDTKKRIFAAHKLLTEKTTSKEKIELVRSLIKGLNPRVDKLLENFLKAFSDLEKFHKDEIIELTAEYLPENTEEEKKRKKAFLWFIRNWKSLHSEIDRIKKEFELKTKSTDQDIAKMWKIATGLKGSLGITTILATLIVLIFILPNSKGLNKKSINNSVKITAKKIRVINFEGKKIPLTELTISQGPECTTGNEQAQHYHAKDHVTAEALDGSSVSNPGGCGFGKVKEIKIVEVD